jgi:hypothetical protein
MRSAARDHARERFGATLTLGEIDALDRELLSARVEARAGAGAACSWA